MFFSKPTFLSAAVLGAAATVAMVTVAPVQAASLAGSTANIIGVATFSSLAVTPAIDNIDFSSEVIAPSSTGIFVVGASVTVSDVALTLVSGPSSYDGSAVNPLIDFGGGLTFEVENPFAVTRFGTGTSAVAATFPGFKGKFILDGDVVGGGFLSANQILGNGSFSLTVRAVPEPLTMLGAGAAVAFGASFKRKLAQKNNKSEAKS